MSSKKRYRNWFERKCLGPALLATETSPERAREALEQALRTAEAARARAVARAALMKMEVGRL